MLYAEITEVGRALLGTIRSVIQALRDMRYEYAHDNYLAERESLQQAWELRDLAGIQTKRFQDMVADVRLGNDYCLDPTDIDNMIRRALVHGPRSAPRIDHFVPNTPCLALNVVAILNELEEKTERSKRHMADLEVRLSELLEKYQTT